MLMQQTSRAWDKAQSRGVFCLKHACIQSQASRLVTGCRDRVGVQIRQASSIRW